jgi:hypothetical protein
MKFEQIEHEVYGSLLLEQPEPPPAPGGAAPAGMPPPGGAPAMPGAPAAPGGAPAGAPPAEELSKKTTPATKEDIDPYTFITERMKALVDLGAPEFTRFVKQARNKAERYMLLRDFKQTYPEAYDIFDRFITVTKEGSPEFRELITTFKEFIDLVDKHITTIDDTIQPSEPEQAPM